jgi:hypothetical protein
MKNSIFRTGVRWVLLAVFLKALTVQAQMLDGVPSAMVKLFGGNSFTAQGEMRVTNSSHVLILQMPTAFAADETKLRLDLDMKLIKSSIVAPEMIKMFVQAGKDRITSVVRPDKKMTYIIYPGAHMYSVMPLSPSDAEIANQKLEKKQLGKETIDGHACVKNQAVVRSPKGTVLLQATTWNATDLKDFPIQIEMKDNGNSTILHFMNVNLVKPDPKLFDIPAGYKEEGAPAPKAAAPAPKKK